MKTFLIAISPLVAFIVLVFTVIAFVVHSPEAYGPEKRAAYDKASLECRLSGGTYENFHTQGYHCIGGKK